MHLCSARHWQEVTKPIQSPRIDPNPYPRVRVTSIRSMNNIVLNQSFWLKQKVSVSIHMYSKLFYAWVWTKRLYYCLFDQFTSCPANWQPLTELILYFVKRIFHRLLFTTIRSIHINNIASNHHKYTISSQEKRYRHQLKSILDIHHITSDIIHFETVQQTVQ